MIAAGIRIGLCALVLFYLVGNINLFRNGKAIFTAVLIYLAVTIITLIASTQIGKTTPLVVRFGTIFDAIYFTGFSALSGGYTSPLNFLIFFVLIDAATGHKFSRSVRLILLAVGLFGVVSVFTLPENRSYLDLSLTLGILIVLGFTIAYRSGHERELKQKLMLTQQIAAIASPRLGLDRAIGISLNLLRDHFRVKESILLLTDRHTDELSIFRPEDSSVNQSQSRQIITDYRFFEKALSIPMSLSAIYYGKKSFFRLTSAITTATDREKMGELFDERDLSDIAEALDARQFLSVPVNVDGFLFGRLFLLHSDRGARFQSSDLQLVQQIVQYFIPLIENSRLIDNISSSAAEEERKRIARDIHDSIIQPYLGIQLGLEALSGVVGKPDFANQQDLIRQRLASLGELIETTIVHLRNVVGGLADSKTSGTTLLPSVKRFADKFASATGISVNISTHGDMRRADELAPDLFQLAVEGLSNIRKHTDSPSANIDFDVREHSIRIQITNDGFTDEKFHPKTITERVISLGGTVQIIHGERKCVLELEIPLNGSRPV